MQGSHFVSDGQAAGVSVAGFEELRLQAFVLPKFDRGTPVSVAGFEELRLQVITADEYSDIAHVSVAGFEELRLQVQSNTLF